MIRHPLARALLLAGFAFLLGFSYRYHLPKLETMLLVELENLSAKKSPVRVWAQRLHLTLIPLGVTLEDVRLLPQAPVDRYFAPTTLKSLGARLAIWPLLRGELRLAEVFVRDSSLNVFLRPELFKPAVPTASKPKIDFEALYRLPIDELVLDNVQIQGKIEPQNMVFKVSQINCTIENRYRSLFVDLIAPEVYVKPSGPAAPLAGAVEVRALVEALEAQISAVKVRADQSFVVASGHLTGDISAGHLEGGTFDARARLRLPDLNTWEAVFFEKPRLPRLGGRAEVDVGAEVIKGRGTQFETDLSTKNLKIDKFTIGDIQTHASTDLNTIASERVRLSSRAGRVNLDHLKATLKPKLTFKTEVHAEVELQQLLKNLSINVPLLLPIKGDGTCEGTGGDKPVATCHSSLSASRVWIHGDEEHPETIVEVTDARIEGDTQFTPRDVTFKADVALGRNSKGFAHGTVDFDQGFKIFYESDQLDFGDVKNLANLKLEGRAKVQGSTVGTAKWATLDLNANGQTFWLENYPLGRFTGKIGYAKGQLSFNKIQGQLGTTQYQGNVGIDLHQKQIKLGLQLPYADLHDLQSLFQRKVDLPVSFTGTGQGVVEAHGPLHFPDMSYRVRSAFYRGEIANESFDEFIFNVTSKDGFVQSDRITLTKSSGGAEARGTITSAGIIDATAHAHGLRLEQSENINKMGLDLQGLADLQVLVKGQLPKPRVEVRGQISKVVLADVPAEDSAFRLNFLSDRVEGAGHFLGDTLSGDGVYPLVNEAPFQLNLLAKHWDFTNVFQLVSKSARQLDFATSLSGQVNLAAPRGGFWKSTGQVTISEFLLRRGPSLLTAPKPMVLNMQNGEINSSNFGISSGPNYLKLDAAGLTREHLNASLNGKMDLSLLGLFTPFIADLRGGLAISVDLKGSVETPRFSGSALIEKGYAKLNDFPHPISNVRADVLFNDNQIRLNSVRGDLAGGVISGEGQLTLAGKRHPVDVRASFSDVKLNFPENFRTQGSGTLAITGNGFPYNLGVVYNVSGGEITYEMGEGTGGTNNIKASQYLPHFLAQDTFHPFLFDIDINVKHPINVNTTLVRAQVNGDLDVKGTPDRLLLSGTITPAAGAKVYFRDQPFDVASAFFEWNNNVPAEPRIFLTANTHMVEFAQNDAGKLANTVERTYDINLLVQGRGPSPQIQLTSQPPLPQNDIVSLLALGFTTGGGYGDTSGTTLSSGVSESQTTANSSAAIGATILQKAGGKKLKDSLGVDVKVSTTQATPDLASYPKVTLSKQWTPKFGASASSTLQANPSNDVKVEYKVNKNVSVVGSWNGREHDYLQEQNDTSVQSVFGLDLEYKMNFK